MRYCQIKYITKATPDEFKMKKPENNNLEPLAVFVDGENMSLTEVMLLQAQGLWDKAMIKRHYVGDNQFPASLPANFDDIRVTHVGKESVDKAIAMDVVRYYFELGIRKYWFVSNDMDYADTATHIIRTFPDVEVTIAANPLRTSHRYGAYLARHGLNYHPIKSAHQEHLLSKVNEVINDLESDGFEVDMEILAIALVEKFAFGAEIRKVTEALTRLGFRNDEKGRVVFDKDAIQIPALRRKTPLPESDTQAARLNGDYIPIPLDGSDDFSLT